MPLIHSKSKGAVGKNIKREQEAGKPHDQAIAIAMEVQRRAKAKKMADGGMVNEKLDPGHGDDHAEHLMKQVMDHPQAEHIARAVMHKMACGGMYSEGGAVDDSIEDDDMALHNEGDHDEGQEGPMLAEGGEVMAEHDDEMEEDSDHKKEMRKRMLGGIMASIKHKHAV